MVGIGKGDASMPRDRRFSVTKKAKCLDAGLRSQVPEDIMTLFSKSQHSAPSSPDEPETEGSLRRMDSFHSHIDILIRTYSSVVFKEWEKAVSYDPILFWTKNQRTRSDYIELAALLSPESPLQELAVSILGRRRVLRLGAGRVVVFQGVHRL